MVSQQLRQTNRRRVLISILSVVVSLIVVPSGFATGERAAAGHSSGILVAQAATTTSSPSWALLRPSVSIGSLAPSENDPHDGYVLAGGTGTGGLDYSAGYYNGTQWNPLGSADTPTGVLEYTYDYADHYVLGTNATGGTYAYSGGAWSPVQTYSSPGVAGKLTYDGSDGYVLDFVDVSYPTPECDATWSYVHGSWTDHCTAQYPTPRTAGLLAYDYNSSDQYAVLFGGYGCLTYNCTNMGELNDTWVYRSGNWTEENTGSSHPPPVGTAGFDPSNFIYDPSTGMDVAFQNGSSSLWGFNHGAWHQIPVSSWPAAPEGQPTPTFGPALGGKAVMEASQWCTLDEVVSPPGDPSRCPMISIFSNGTWLNESPPAPEFPWRISSMAYDPPDHELIAIGDLSIAYPFFTRDTLAFSGGSWRVVSSSTPTSVSDLVFDPAAGYLLGIGSVYVSGAWLSTTWSFHNNSWTQLFPTVEPPNPAPANNVTTYDTAYYQQGHSVVLYAGGSLMWFFANGQWTNKSLVCYSCTAYPSSIHMVNDVADGYILGVGDVNQTWKFSNGTWTLLHPMHSPRIWADTSLTFDSARDYVLMDSGKIWKWTNGDWTDITPATPPIPKDGGGSSVLAYDPANRMDYLEGSLFILCCGIDGLNSLPYMWTFGVQKTYSLQLQETGLPPGTTWSVSVQSFDLSAVGQSSTISRNSSTGTLSISLTNGTWTVLLNGAGGYQPSATEVSVAIHGLRVSLAVTFSKLFQVTFTESGLPRGTSWSVDFDGTIRVTTVSSLAWNETNGTFYYQVGKISGYVAKHTSGSVKIVGKPVSVTVIYT
jgi:hypothetical protein